MGEINLRATDLHWLEGSDPYKDCCVHGGVYLRLRDNVVSDGTDNDRTVSASAYLMLRSVVKGTSSADSLPLIPHCGHKMKRVAAEPDGLFLGGCDIGITWVIRNEGDETIHDLGNKTVSVPRSSWAKAVCDFSDEVHRFLMTAWPKRIDDKTDREGFELFMRLWDRYRSEAGSIPVRLAA